MAGGKKLSLYSDRLLLLYILRDSNGIYLSQEHKTLLKDWIKEIKLNIKRPIDENKS
jgi:hypothetical protein